jgi:hypothetical protein
MIKVELDGLCHTIMNTHIKPVYTCKGKELMQFMQYLLFMGEYFFILIKSVLISLYSILW